MGTHTEARSDAHLLGACLTKIASTVTVIPARGGSKRIPGKNLRPLAGIPLVIHTIRHAQAARLAGDVYVSTDDPEIAALARATGARLIRRPAELADDNATTESAVLHVLDERRGEGFPDPELVVLLQCTSPIRRPADIDRAVETLIREGADSLLSVCENTRYVWTIRNGAAQSLNYDYHRRQREQDLEPQFQENGSIYISRTSLLRSTGNRLGTRIAFYMMDYWASFQVDVPEDFELCEWIMRRPEYRPPIDWPARISLVVFDFDGVLTDNSVLTQEDGSEAVTSSRADGLGLEQLRRSGVPLLVLSKERNRVVEARCAKLELPCLQGVDDKAMVLSDYLRERNIPTPEVIYVGNDANDVDCLRLVGFPVVVGDAHPSVIAEAKLVLKAPGGRGAVRELCDLIVERV